MNFDPLVGTSLREKHPLNNRLEESLCNSYPINPIRIAFRFYLYIPLQKPFTNPSKSRKSRRSLILKTRARDPFKSSLGRISDFGLLGKRNLKRGLNTRGKRYPKP